jgi:hypothetical protein
MHLLTEKLGAHLPIWFMGVSICPTLEVVNNPMEEVVRNFPLFGQILVKIKYPPFLKFHQLTTFCLFFMLPLTLPIKTIMKWKPFYACIL